MAMPFDTLKLARRLESAGFPPNQAGDMSDAFAEAIGTLTTKDDLIATKNDLRHEIAKLDARLTVLMWAVGINSALTVAILGMLLRAGGHVP
jgi:hypothetical protein